MSEVSYQIQEGSIVRINDELIDCVVHHPQLGWIPYTACKNDSVEFGRKLFEFLDSYLKEREGL